MKQANQQVKIFTNSDFFAFVFSLYVIPSRKAYQSECYQKFSNSSLQLQSNEYLKSMKHKILLVELLFMKKMIDYQPRLWGKPPECKNFVKKKHFTLQSGLSWPLTLSPTNATIKSICFHQTFLHKNVALISTTEMKQVKSKSSLIKLQNAFVNDFWNLSWSFQKLHYFEENKCFSKKMLLLTM